MLTSGKHPEALWLHEGEKTVSGLTRHHSDGALNLLTPVAQEEDQQGR